MEADRFNRRFALIACFALDEFRTTGDPDALKRLINLCRYAEQIHAGEAHSSKRRKKRWRTRSPKWLARYPKLSDGVARHLAMVRQVADLNDHLRYIARKVLDGAVVHLMGRHRRLLPLYFVEQTHRMPSGAGLLGHILIQEAANDSGEFFAVENDLTSLLGVGDLTFFPRAFPSSPPVPVELKTHAHTRDIGRLDDVTIEIIQPQAEGQIASEVTDAINSLVGVLPKDEEPESLAREEQLDAMISQADEIIRAKVSPPVAIPPTSGYWASIKLVGRKAVDGDPSFDVVEPGLCVFGVRSNETGHLVRDYKSIRRRIKSVWNPSERLHSATSRDAIREDIPAYLITPVSLWPLPLAMRADILNGDLIVGSLIDWTPVVDQLEADGVSFTRSGGRWILSDGTRTVEIDETKSGHLHAKVAFGESTLREMVVVLRTVWSAESSAS